MSKNYIFRKFECGLSKEETAQLCFKTVRTVTAWDSGKDIPPECKRLMRMASGREISHDREWSMFSIKNGKLELPTSQSVTPQQILLGIALLEIGAENDRKVITKILRCARAISKIMIKSY